MTLLQYITETHGGLLAVLALVGLFTTIAWACDEREKRKPH